MATSKIQLSTKEKKKITNLEMLEFFSEMDKKEFSSILTFAIEEGIIDVNRALHLSIKNFKCSYSIYSMAICFRLGADSNSYNEDGMHVLTHLYSVTEGVNSKVNMASILCIYYGSNPTNKSHSNQSNSVLDWLNSKRYNHNMEAMFPNYTSIADSKTMLTLGILTDSDENIGDQQMDSADIKHCIMAKSNTMLSRSVHINDISGMDIYTIHLSIEYHNTGSFKYYTNMGHKVSYPMMNFIIYKLKVYKKKKEYLSYDNYLSLIELAISNGQMLDTHQQSLLSSSSPSAYQSIMEKYNVPYWEKECGYRGGRHSSIPDRLRKLAIMLDLEIDNDQRGVCDSIRKISGINTDTIVEAARLRQEDRLRSKHSSLDEYSHGAPKEVKYFNQSIVDGDYNDYLDICCSSYRDSGGRIWGFLCRDYSSILESKKNPINGSSVPDSLIDEISRKKKRLEDIGIDTQVPLKFSDVIRELFNPDAVSNEESIRQLSKLESNLASIQVGRHQLELVTIEQLESSMSNAGYSTSIKYLKRDHALITTAYIVNYHMIYKKEMGIKMLNNIKRNAHNDSMDVYHVPTPVRSSGSSSSTTYRRRRDRSNDN